jgi:hypothetical protein
MLLDVSIGKDSLSVEIRDPFHMDLESVLGKIEGFLAERQDTGEGLDIGGLLSRMIRGIAGCEGGCPADAKSLVSRGFDRFDLEYVEGGILTAKAITKKGTALFLRMFPEF